MESKGGKKSNNSNLIQYETPLGYSIEDLRPAGGIEKFQSVAYSNVMRSHAVLISPYFHISSSLESKSQFSFSHS
ncbi:hypothetical protein LUZ60_002886 [Juncus effusus]|nr:hypothetical protein LUZ60_002886 [Juncus effusus]